jgi:hypothetical protein
VANLRNPPRFFRGVSDAAAVFCVPAESRAERIEAVMKQLLPKIEQTVRHQSRKPSMSPGQRSSVPSDFEFRDAGLELVNEVRQANVASRKNRHSRDT